MRYNTHIEALKTTKSNDSVIIGKRAKYGKKNMNDSYSIIFEIENNNASGAIDLRSNRNRPMILSRRKLRQQARKWRSVDFLLISLSCRFIDFSTWFQGETYPISRQYIIVICRLPDIRIRRCYFLMSEPFLDLENVESPGFNLGFNQPCNSAPMPHIVRSKFLMDLLSLCT